MKTETLTVINAAKILIAELRKVYGENIEWQELHDLENAIDNEEIIKALQGTEENPDTIIGEFTHPELNECIREGNYKFKDYGKIINTPDVAKLTGISQTWSIDPYKFTETSRIQADPIVYENEGDYNFDLNLLKEKGLLI